jgi:exosome complex RNA-binding protein Rrp4
MALVLPGQDIVDAASEGGGAFLRGHGTFVEGGRLLSSLVGQVERVNALVTVRPLQGRYGGEVGDVVVGRILDVQSKRWHVDISGRQDALLLLSSVNLSDGVQRRRTEEDQLNMRSFFAEDDLISAEVRAVFADGSLSLHARSLKYGKLENGQVVRVPASLMRRLKQHFCALPCGVDVILGLNGHIWLTAALEEGAGGSGGGGAGGGGGGGAGEAATAAAAAAAAAAAEAAAAAAGAAGGAAGAAGAAAAAAAAAADLQDAEAGLVEAIERRKRLAAEREVPAEARLRVCRARNCILALAQCGLAILPEAISLAFQASEELGLAPEQLLDPAQASRVCASARAAARARAAAAAAAAAAASGSS